MGISRAVVRLLLEEKRRQPFTGSVIQFGKQAVYLTQAEVEHWARVHAVPLAKPSEISLSHDPALARFGCIDDRTFFSELGFSDVRSCDYADWEGCDFTQDLNLPLRGDLKGRFDAVYDPGTIQHVFDVPQMFLNVFDFLRVGGRAIHAMAPSQNHVDQGFFGFSPTFFWDFYTANKFRLECLYLLEFKPLWYLGRFQPAVVKVYRYTPGSLDAVSFGGLDASQMCVFVVATKTAESTGHVIPQQGMFREFWPQDAPKRIHHAGLGTGADAGPLTWRERLALNPAVAWAYLAAKRIKREVRRTFFRKMPPLVAKY